MSGEFVKAGYLVKSPPDFKALVAQWHKRWFLLMDSKLVYPLAARYVRLEYYQSEQDAKRLGDPKGVINLNTCSKVNSREPMKGHKYVFDIHTDERVYHLVAESGEEKQDWIHTLNNLLFTTNQTQTKAQSPSRERRWSPPQQRQENGILRPRNSLKTQRPLSYCSPSPSLASPRPLPPVPKDSPPRPHRQRPLPPPPSDKPPTPPPLATSEHKPVSPKPKKRGAPPPKPPPYRKANSNPTTLTPVDISGVYDVAPGQTSVMVHPSPNPNRKILAQSLTDDDDYSVLENAALTPDSDGDMYSHLDPTEIRHGRRSLPEQVPHSKGVHNVILTNDEEYSILHH